MPAYRIVIDRALCIGAGSCVAIAQRVFALDERSKAIVVDTSGADPETILLAAKVCPTLAISIIDTETGKQLWPVIAEA